MKYIISVLIPQQILVETGPGVAPVVFKDGTCAILGTGGPTIVVPLSSFLGCYEKPEENQIIMPEGLSHPS